jgi:osmotically-inducible protein OsmY
MGNVKVLEFVRPQHGGPLSRARRSGWRRDRGLRGGWAMSRGVAVIGGIGLGAGLMYLLDPDLGSRRRALVRDKLVRTAHQTGDAVDATSRDVSNRARGLAAETGSRLSEDDANDEVVAERVRSELGGTVRHPGSIAVRVENGRVTLSGPILADEVDRLLAQVSSVRSVTGVENRLEVHEQAGNTPGLQGAPRGEAGTSS